MKALTSNKLGGIAAFVTAAEAASFSVAAEQMGLSRSAVGKAVGRLEERLGVRLFQRTTRSLSLTEEGELFYEHCSSALAQLDAAEAIFELGKRKPAGRVRISLPVLLGRHCISPILVGLAGEHPQLQMEIAFTDRLVDLREDGFDLVVRTGQLRDQADLKARWLGVQSMVLCASPSYLRKHGAPSTVDEVRLYEAVAYGKGNNIIPWRFIDQGREVEIQPAGRLRLDDLQAIGDAAIAGRGLAWLPGWLIAAQLRSGELVEVLPEARGKGFDIYAVWPLGRYLPMRVRLVIDELAEKVARIPGLERANN
ncbi:MAG: LysR family transcriptional regulator [Terriglobales bacterium]